MTRSLLRITLCLLPFCLQAQTEDPLRIQSDSLLGVAERYMGHQDSIALAIANDVRKIAIEHWGENSLINARALGVLAQVSSNRGAYSESEAIRQKALPIYLTLAPDSVITAGFLSNFGGLYIQIAQYDKAEQFLKNALALMERINRTGHNFYATTLGKIGELYKDQGRYDEAEVALIKAKDARLKRFGNKHARYSDALYGLAIFYLESNQLELAEQALLDVRSIDEATIGKQSQDYGGTLNALGNLYNEMGKFEKAETYFKEVIAIIENHSETNWPFLGMVYNNIGSTYSQMGLYPQAEQSILRVCLKSLNCLIRNALWYKICYKSSKKPLT